MAYVFALDELYYDRERGPQIYRLIPRDDEMPNRPATPPTPSEWIPGTVPERDPDPPVRSCTPETLLFSPDREARTHQVPHPDSGDSDACATYLREGPQLQFGFIGEEPRTIRRSSDGWINTSAAYEAFSQNTSPTGSYAGSLRGPGSEEEDSSQRNIATGSAQSTSAHLSSTPIRSAPGSLDSTYTFRSLSDHRGAGRSSDCITDSRDQVILSGNARANFLKTPKGAFRQSTLDEYFERLTLAVLKTSTAAPSNLPTTEASSTREGSSGSDNRGAISGGQSTVTDHAHLPSAETSSASGSAVLTPSGSSDTSCNNDSDNRATLSLGQAQSITEYERTPGPSLRFNLERAATFLSSDDAYRGSVLPTIPGTTEYLVDENGSRLSSREAVSRHGATHVAEFLHAHRRRISTTQGRAEIELQFTRLRNLYHFTASPHLILVANWYDQFLTSFDEPSLWDIYPDDTPATSFP